MKSTALRRRFRCAPLLLLVLHGCATTSAGKPDLLAFLGHEPVNKEAVLAHLGGPNATFEGERVLTYRLESDKGGFAVQRNNPKVEGWEGVSYDLVLVFDDNGLLQRHNLVAVRPP
jgi:hypothetical protein